MPSFQLEVPRWISLFFFLFGIIFGFVWLQGAFESGNIAFILLGVSIIITFGITAIYMLVTGKSPYKLTQIK